jgi:hypothetical protein
MGALWHAMKAKFGTILHNSNKTCIYPLGRLIHLRGIYGTHWRVVAGL